MHQLVLRLCVRGCPILVLLIYVDEDTRWLVDLLRDLLARVPVPVLSLRFLKRMTKIAREVDHPHEKERDLGPSQEREREAEAEAEVETDIIADTGIARYPPPKMRRRQKGAENVDENDDAAARTKNLLMIVLQMISMKTKRL
jgi:hypothetical protein